MYFQQRDTFQRTFTLAGDHDVAVVVIPPPAYELYFRHSELKLSSRDQAGIENASTLLITPPSGLNDIIKVSIADSTAKLEAIAPDPKRFMRSIRDALAGGQIPAVLLTHEQIVTSRHDLADQHPFALQCHFVDIAKEGDKKQGTYRTTLAFSLVDARSGRAIATKTIEAASTDITAGPSTAFYSCIQDAAQTFVRDADIRRLCAAPLDI